MLAWELRKESQRHAFLGALLDLGQEHHGEHADVVGDGSARPCQLSGAAEERRSSVCVELCSAALCESGRDSLDVHTHD